MCGALAKGKRKGNGEGDGEGERRRWQGAALDPGATMLSDTRGDAPEAISFNLLAVQPI